MGPKSGFETKLDSSSNNANSRFQDPEKAILDMIRLSGGKKELVSVGICPAWIEDDRVVEVKVCAALQALVG
jgi:hypothetical protein